jgi:4'-phosphopantetheinyl transferase
VPLEPAIFWCAADLLSRRAATALIEELSDEEARRAAAFAFERDRRTYIAAHALVRRALKRRLDGAEPYFVRSPDGRPELTPAQLGRPALSFNLTHTCDFAACALLRGAPVGIDAEDMRRPIDIAAVAGRWFAVPERRLLERHSGVDRAHLFFRIWTLKEAILKATGQGLRIQPQLFAIDPDLGEAVIPRNLGIATSWRLAEFVPLPHIRLAVAVPGAGEVAPSLTRIDLG